MTIKENLGVCFIVTFQRDFGKSMLVDGTKPLCMPQEGDWPEISSINDELQTF